MVRDISPAPDSEAVSLRFCWHALVGPLSSGPTFYETPSSQPERRELVFSVSHLLFTPEYLLLIPPWMDCCLILFASFFIIRPFSNDHASASWVTFSRSDWYYSDHRRY